MTATKPASSDHVCDHDDPAKCSQAGTIGVTVSVADELAGAVEKPPARVSA